MAEKDKRQIRLDRLTIYTRSLMTWEDQTYPLDGSYNSGLGGGFYRALPAWFPDPCYICAVDLLGESGGNPYPPGTSGILIILHDRKGQYRALETIADADPDGNIVAGEYLHRLVVLDIQQGSYRRARQEHSPPVRYSRSEGDLLLANFPGTAPPPYNTFQIWPCWSVVYLVDDALPPPPARAFGVGSWLYGGAGRGGRAINNSGTGRGHAGMRFVAPSAGEISSVRLRAEAVRRKGKVVARLFSDNSGKSPGNQIGVPSRPWLIDAQGAHEPYFDIGCGALVEAKCSYWIVISPVDTALDADFATALPVPAFPSGRADVVTNLVQNLPGWESWRLLITAIVPRR